MHMVNLWTLESGDTDPRLLGQFKLENLPKGKKMVHYYPAGRTTPIPDDEFRSRYGDWYVYRSGKDRGTVVSLAEPEAYFKGLALRFSGSQIWATNAD